MIPWWTIPIIVPFIFIAGAWCRGLKAADDEQARTELMRIIRDHGQAEL